MNTHSRLVVFFYVGLREGLFKAGDLNNLVGEHVDKANAAGCFILSDKDLENQARYFADRLNGG